MKKNFLTAFLSIAIIIISLTFFIINVVKPLDIWTHPILNFLVLLFLGFGLLFTLKGFFSKSTITILFGSIMLSLSIFYITIQYLPWYVALISSVCYALCISIISNTLYGNKNDYADNDSPDYKNYLERKMENVNEKEKEDLPKIKSFK